MAKSVEQRLETYGTWRSDATQQLAVAVIVAVILTAINWEVDHSVWLTLVVLVVAGVIGYALAHILAPAQNKMIATRLHLRASQIEEWEKQHAAAGEAE